MNIAERERLTLALTEALRENIYPRSPIEGVAPYRPFIAPVGHVPELSKTDEELLVHLTIRINRILAGSAAFLAQGQENGYFTRLLTCEETDAATIQAAEAVLTIAQKDKSIHVICPPAGATPLARLLNGLGYPLDHIHSVEVSGSSGTNSGTAEVKKQVLSPAILDPNNSTIVFEDLWDSDKTILELALLRDLKRDPGALFGNDRWKYLQTGLQTAHENHNHAKYPSTYREFVQKCAANLILLLPVFSKNAEALQALQDALLMSSHILNPSNPRHMRWRKLQQELLDRYPIKAIDNVWVVGAGLLDTGIFISRVFDKLPDTLKNHHIKRFMNPPDEYSDKRNEWLLRIGTTVPGLAYLNRKLHHEDNIIELAANELKKMLERN